MSTIYVRPITTHLNHMGNIVTAYRQAGLTPPTLGGDIEQKIQTAPGPAEVARKLAVDALQAEDVDAWHAEALEQIREAQAADTLRREFNSVFPHVIRAAADGYIAEAAEDLRAPFDRLAKTFTQAAAKLPSGQSALDPEAVIAADAGAALNTVRDCLARFGAYAGIFHADAAVDDYPSDLNIILPLVDLPTPVVEQVYGLTRSTANEEKLEQTRAIRRMATDLRSRGADPVLVGIARGEYGKATLKLATAETLQLRKENASLAHSRERVEL